MIFALTNNGILPVYIPDLSYDILVNDISIGKDHSNVDMTINPGETKEITSFQNLQKNSLSPAVYSIVDSQGIMDIKVKGIAYFKLILIDIPIPFESSKQISIYDEIRDKINTEKQTKNFGWFFCRKIPRKCIEFYCTHIFDTTAMRTSNKPSKINRTYG